VKKNDLNALIGYDNTIVADTITKINDKHPLLVELATIHPLVFERLLRGKRGENAGALIMRSLVDRERDVISAAHKPGIVTLYKRYAKDIDALIKDPAFNNWSSDEIKRRERDIDEKHRLSFNASIKSQPNIKPVHDLMETALDVAGERSIPLVISLNRYIARKAIKNVVENVASMDGRKGERSPDIYGKLNHIEKIIGKSDDFISYYRAMTGVPEENRSTIKDIENLRNKIRASMKSAISEWSASTWSW
jgi:hypothetical protein